MKPRQSRPRFVVCIRNENYRVSLELNKIYRTVPDDDAKSHRLLRVVDESGEDYLYPEDWFVPVNLPRSTQKALASA